MGYYISGDDKLSISDERIVYTDTIYEVVFPKGSVGKINDGMLGIKIIPKHTIYTKKNIKTGEITEGSFNVSFLWPSTGIAELRRELKSFMKENDKVNSVVYADYKKIGSFTQSTYTPGSSSGAGSIVGGAVAGGMIAGPAGAVVGGMIGLNKALKKK